MISVSAFTFFSFNAGPTLYFHTGTPGPVPYRNAKALTCRLLSEACCVSTIPVQRQLSNEILTDKTPAVKPKSFILWFPEALLSIHFPYCEVPPPLPGVFLFLLSECSSLHPM